MTQPCRGIAALLVFAGPLLAQQPPAKPETAKLPATGLPPAKLIPGLCLLKYRTSTASPQCQAFFDQGLGYFYSYVWMEASRSFEAATRHDPNCPLAWWGLSRAMEKWGKGDWKLAIKKAQELLPQASHREQLLINARLQEKGITLDSNPEDRRKAAIKTIDELLTLYEDDEEGWYYRAQLTEGGVNAVPFYKAVLRINPLHPGANHELVHFYENFRRPALGWVASEKYIESSPGIPHAYHMQAHLATRLGRWDKTSDRSARAIELQRAYHKEMNVEPKQDWQYGHHLEILTLALIHDGRFKEARAIKAEAWAIDQRHWLPWFRLHLAERDWAEALKVVANYRKTDKAMSAYLSALVYLRQGDLARATPEVEVLRQAYRTRKNDKELENRLWEVQGLLLSRSGGGDAGLKLLARLVERTKDDYRHHAWGNGAYYMEAWGIAALHAGNSAIAEEAFLEALAHDRGSARAAMGLQVLCQRQGRTEEASRYADLAHRCWRKADPRDLESEWASLRGENSPQSALRAQREEKPKEAIPVSIEKKTGAKP